MYPVTAPMLSNASQSFDAAPSVVATTTCGDATGRPMLQSQSGGDVQTAAAAKSEQPAGARAGCTRVAATGQHHGHGSSSTTVPAGNAGDFAGLEGSIGAAWPMDTQLMQTMGLGMGLGWPQMAASGDVPTQLQCAAASAWSVPLPSDQLISLLQLQLQQQQAAYLSMQAMLPGYEHANGLAGMVQQRGKAGPSSSSRASAQVLAAHQQSTRVPTDTPSTSVTHAPVADSEPSQPPAQPAVAASTGISTRGRTGAASSMPSSAGSAESAVVQPQKPPQPSAVASTDDDAPADAVASSSSASSAAAGGGGARSKKRFLWTEDLHRRFVGAVFDLGLQTITPKALFALMQPSHEPVMTSDHVKSHLQKFRLNSKSGRDMFLKDYERARREADARATDQLKRTGTAPQAAHFSVYPMSMPPAKQADGGAAVASAATEDNIEPPCHRCEQYASLFELGVGLPDDEHINELLASIRSLLRATGHTCGGGRVSAGSTSTPDDAAHTEVRVGPEAAPTAVGQALTSTAAPVEEPSIGLDLDVLQDTMASSSGSGVYGQGSAGAQTAGGLSRLFTSKDLPAHLADTVQNQVQGASWLEAGVPAAAAAAASTPAGPAVSSSSAGVPSAAAGFMSAAAARQLQLDLAANELRIKHLMEQHDQVQASILRQQELLEGQAASGGSEEGVKSFMMSTLSLGASALADQTKAPSSRKTTISDGSVGHRGSGQRLPHSSSSSAASSSASLSGMAREAGVSLTSLQLHAVDDGSSTGTSSDGDDDDFSDRNGDAAAAVAWPSNPLSNSNLLRIMTANAAFTSLDPMMAASTPMAAAAALQLSSSAPSAPPDAFAPAEAGSKAALLPVGVDPPALFAQLKRKAALTLDELLQLHPRC